MFQQKSIKTGAGPDLETLLEKDWADIPRWLLGILGLTNNVSRRVEPGRSLCPGRKQELHHIRQGKTQAGRPRQPEASIQTSSQQSLEASHNVRGQSRRTHPHEPVKRGGLDGAATVNQSKMEGVRGKGIHAK